MYDNSKYAYIVGRLRALDTKMMNQNLLERLMDSKNADEAFRVLNDMPLMMGSINDYEAKDFNKVLQGSLQELKDLLKQMAPYPEVLDMLWYKYDFHNLKLILKAKLTERGYSDVEHALVDLGNISFEDWEKHLLEDKTIKITDDLGKYTTKAKEAFEKTNDPQVVDQVMDAYYLDVMQDLVSKMESGLLTRYVKRLIDFSNLRAFIRASEMKKDKFFLEGVLLCGGHVDLEVFLNSFERGYDDLRQTLEKIMHADDLVVALEHFIEEKTLIVVEKKAHELQQQFMEDAKKITFGPEPVFAFFWRFENHLQIIRAVLVGKLNSLPAEDISKHVLSL